MSGKPTKRIKIRQRMPNKKLSTTHRPVNEHGVPESLQGCSEAFLRDMGYPIPLRRDGDYIWDDDDGSWYRDPNRPRREDD